MDRMLKWPPPVPPVWFRSEVFKQHYTSCMKVGTGGNLGLSREYHKKLLGPLFYSWWDCPLKHIYRLVTKSFSGLQSLTNFILFREKINHPYPSLVVATLVTTLRTVWQLKPLAKSEKLLQHLLLHLWPDTWTTGLNLLSETQLKLLAHLWPCLLVTRFKPA